METPRVVGRPFQKGQSGNPSGRPKSLKITRLLERELEQPASGSKWTTQAEQLVHVVVQRALAGQAWACQLIWERLEGKAPQPIDLAGTVTHEHVDLTKLTDRELTQLERVIAHASPDTDARAN